MVSAQRNQVCKGDFSMDELIPARNGRIPSCKAEEL